LSPKEKQQDEPSSAYLNREETINQAEKFARMGALSKERATLKTDNANNRLNDEIVEGIEEKHPHEPIQPRPFQERPTITYEQLLAAAKKVEITQFNV